MQPSKAKFGGQRDVSVSVDGVDPRTKLRSPDPPKSLGVPAILVLGRGRRRIPEASKTTHLANQRDPGSERELGSKVRWRRPRKAPDY